VRALARLWSFGAQDADRRMTAALTPQPLSAIDRYLHESALVTAIDRVTQRIAAWWTNSTTASIATMIVETIAHDPRRETYRNLATVLLIGVIVHISLMLLQGTGPGWMWAVIPALAAAYAAAVFAVTLRSDD
jgi:hypothetical protein